MSRKLIYLRSMSEPLEVGRPVLDRIAALTKYAESLRDFVLTPILFVYSLILRFLPSKPISTHTVLHPYVYSLFLTLLLLT
jgi:hypothetical protein